MLVAVCPESPAQSAIAGATNVRITKAILFWWASNKERKDLSRLSDQPCKIPSAMEYDGSHSHHPVELMQLTRLQSHEGATPVPFDGFGDACNFEKC